MINRNNSGFQSRMKPRFLRKAQQGLKFQPINISDYRYDDTGKIVNNKTGQTGTLASSEVKVTAKRPPVVNRLLQSVANGFIGASVADAPVIATAGGWKRDKNGNWDQRPDSSTQRLSNNLAEISTMSPTNYGTALVDNAIRYLPKALLYGAGKYGNNYMKNLARAKIISKELQTSNPAKDTPNTKRFINSNYQPARENEVNSPTAAIVFRGSKKGNQLLNTDGYTYFTSDPEYAAQYGKVQTGIIGYKNPGYTDEPIVAHDMEMIHFYTDDNLYKKGLPSSDVIIGNDLVTHETLSNGKRLIPSKGTEYVIWNPKQWMPLNIYLNK